MLLTKRKKKHTLQKTVQILTLVIMTCVPQGASDRWWEKRGSCNKEGTVELAGVDERDASPIAEHPSSSLSARLH